jgi:cyclophilin family peptidyl-prolyl cis-trans isomerase
MKSFLLTLPLAVMLTSCSAPATEDNNPDNFLSTNATPAANNNSATSSTAGDASTQSTAAASSGYRVVDEDSEGMPGPVVEALKKAKVPPPPASMKVPDKPRVRLTTSKGNITLELDSKAAPLHVKSFVYLTGRNFYDGVLFHRYVPGFVIQGGDPLSKNPKLGAPYADVAGSPTGFHGAGGPGYQVPREHNNLKHERFVLAAARSSDPDSAGGQFYITLDKQTSLDRGNPDSVDPHGYTVFGKVVSGSDVVMKLRGGDKIIDATVLK